MNVILDLQDQAHKLSFSQLKASIAVLASTIQGDQSELPTVAISPLNLSDVQVMLKLKHSLSNLEFRNKPPVGLSPICGTYPLGNIQNKSVYSHLSFNF